MDSPDREIIRRYVPGEGPMPARVMLIGEGPGDEENKHGRPFIGKSGELLDRLLGQSNLNRNEIYVTNLVKFQVPGNGDPSVADLRRDARELREEIRAVKPQFVGLLGRMSARHFLGDIDLEWAHGLAFGGYGRAWMPMYHPAFGLHSPEVLPLVQDDIQHFALMTKGQIIPARHRDEFPKPEYVLLESHGKVHIKVGAPVYVDTEGSVDKPWGLSFTQEPGRAYVILAGNAELLRMFAFAILAGNCQVVLHNAMHDIPVLRAMGITFDNFRDTMIRAYHLCLEPQGLKPLARRHAAMIQDSYEEVIAAAQKKISVRYLEEALAWLNKHCPEESKTSSKPKRKAKKSITPPAGKKSVKISPLRQQLLSEVSEIWRKQLSMTSR